MEYAVVQTRSGGVTVLRGKYFVEFVVVTGGVTVIFQNPDFVVVDFVVVTSWWI